MILVAAIWKIKCDYIILIFVYIYIYLCYIYIRSKQVNLGDMKNCSTLVVKIESLKGTLSGLRQFLAIESPLKVMKMLFISHQKLFPF